MEIIIVSSYLSQAGMDANSCRRRKGATGWVKKKKLWAAAA
jgi:hypothetical protein